MTITYKLALPLLTTSFLFACSDDPDTAPRTSQDMPSHMDASSDMSSMPLETMRPGLYKISSVDADDSCQRSAPTQDLLVRVTDEGLLEYGEIILPPGDTGGFFGCLTGEVDTSDGFPRTYHTIMVTPTSDTQGGYTLDFDVERFDRRTLLPCSGFTVVLEPFEDCELPGRYRTTSVQLTQGSCDVEWESDEVILEPSDSSGLSMNWNSASDISGTRLMDTCGWSGTRGISTENKTDLWVFNNATREVSLTWSQDEEGVVRATIEDSIMGETFDQLSCEGGTFEVALERYTGIEEDAASFDTMCAAPRPTVCGDGICMDDEHCGVCEEDCGCEDGTACDFTIDEQMERTYECFKTCDEPLVTGQCDSGQRCGDLRSSYTNSVFAQGTELYCVAAGDRQKGELCSTINDCVEGLFCQVYNDALSSTSGTCSEPCDMDCAGERESCKKNNSLPLTRESCILSCDLFTSGSCPREDQICSGLGVSSQTTCVSRATDLTGEGSACGENDSCAPGFICIESSQGFGEPRTKACRLPCDVDADCARLADTTCNNLRNYGVCLR